MSPPSDSELVQRLAQADERAFVQTYEQYSARLLGFLVRLTKDRVLAEDLFQETWCRLASSVHNLQPETDLFAWLLTVARNAYFDQARRSARLGPLAPGENDGTFDLVSYTRMPEHEALDHEQLVLLERALGVLSDLDREILLLIGVEDLPQTSVARILGIGAVALRKRLSRARERLELTLARLTAEQVPTKGAARD